MREVPYPPQMSGAQGVARTREGGSFPGLNQRTPCDSERVIKAGGALVDHLMHPSFVPLEQLYRKLPTGAIFSASPQSNYRFELGAFTVPRNMAFALVDYRFDIYRPSGLAPADPIPIEERRLSTYIGYDVTISEYRKGQVQYQLTPSAPSPSQQATEPQRSPGRIAAGNDFAGLQPNYPYDPTNPFPPSSAPQGPVPTDFANARAAAAASPGGPGLALLPQRTERQGPLVLPLTYVVEQTQRVAFDVVVFGPVPIPIAFFEVSFTGVLMPANTLAEIFKAAAPCGGVP